jgi:hypothetical protein
MQIEGGNENENNPYTMSPYYFMYASILASDSDTELHLLRDGKTRSTAGSIVSSLYHLKDTDGIQGAFFIFPDLSVRMEGTYRLKFSMYQIINDEIHFCSSIISDNYSILTFNKMYILQKSFLEWKNQHLFRKYLQSKD